MNLYSNMVCECDHYITVHWYLKSYFKSICQIKYIHVFTIFSETKYAISCLYNIVAANLLDMLFYDWFLNFTGMILTIDFSTTPWLPSWSLSESAFFSKTTNSFCQPRSCDVSLVGVIGSAMELFISSVIDSERWLTDGFIHGHQLLCSVTGLKLVFVVMACCCKEGM